MKFLRRFPAALSRFTLNNTGVAAIEFALSISVLLLLFLGTVEVSRYILIIQKLEKTVSTMADVVTQTDPNTTSITDSEMSQLYSAITDMMSPYTFTSSDGYVIITDVYQSGTNNPIVQWQYCGTGTGSRVGVTGGAATLPGGFTMMQGEEVVIGEIFYNFHPMINQSILPNLIVYRYAIFMPRLGALTQNPNFSSSTCH